MAKIHLSLNHPIKELTAEEKESEEKLIVLSALAKLLPQNDPDKAKIDQFIGERKTQKLSKGGL